MWCLGVVEGHGFGCVAVGEIWGIEWSYLKFSPLEPVEVLGGRSYHTEICRIYIFVEERVLCVPVIEGGIDIYPFLLVEICVGIPGDYLFVVKGVGKGASLQDPWGGKTDTVPYRFYAVAVHFPFLLFGQLLHLALQGVGDSQ